MTLEYQEIIEREEKDKINPSYYNGNISCIDAMEAAYGTEAVMHFCQCNAFKYQWRFERKNGTQDLEKSMWYQRKYIELKNKVDAMSHFSGKDNK